MTMTKNEKNYYLNKKSIAYYSDLLGSKIMEIKNIEYGIEGCIIFVVGARCNTKSVHRAKIYYAQSGRKYFMFNGRRIFLDECIKL